MEKGTAPDRIIATKFVNPADHSKGVTMTRPLCPYPQIAKYKGSGDTNDAANFDCTLGTNGVYRLGDPGVTPPRALHTPEPDFSEHARKNEIQGTVVLSAIIDSDGSVKAVKVVRPLEPSLDAEAVDAVKKWKFAPARKDGQPVACAMNIEVEFRLGRR